MSSSSAVEEWIRSLLSAIVDNCDRMYAADVERYGSPYVVNREVQRITGLNSCPALVDYLRSVGISEGDPVVQKLRRRATSVTAPHRHVVRGFHRTKGRAAGNIMHTEFKCSPPGRVLLGEGIYFTTRPEDVEGKASAEDGPVLECEVDVGRIKYVTHSCPDMTLQQLNAEGFDSVWARAGSCVSRDEFCVFEAWRVRIVGVVLCDTPNENLRMLASCPDFNPFVTQMDVPCSSHGCRGVVDMRTGVCSRCGGR